jgi:SAM-dependent methyltransferase
MNLEYLDKIRSTELEFVLSAIGAFGAGRDRKTISILEIGAGTGGQAKRLSSLGFSVEAIDIENSNYAQHRVWPVTNYDGKHIPFADRHFDIVFSSNVLEHIPHLDDFQGEMQRVLKPDGIAIHIVPSGSWRFWTNLTHYPFVLKSVVEIVRNKIATALKGAGREISGNGVISGGGLSGMPLVRKALFPHRHGETGNAISEMYYFSRSRWSALFRRSGWVLKRIAPYNLFYTGNVLFGSALPIRARKYLSYILGSSCHLFVLKKEQDTSPE